MIINLRLEIISTPCAYLERYIYIGRVLYFDLEYEICRMSENVSN